MKEPLYGLTKGTPLEPMIEAAAKAEAMAVMNYYALALMAEEQGLPKELSSSFRALADQEAVHAGFYATLNAKLPNDIFRMMENMQRGEAGADKFLQPLANQFRELERADVAEQIENFIRQEQHHAEVLTTLLEKYRQGK